MLNSFILLILWRRPGADFRPTTYFLLRLEVILLQRKGAPAENYLYIVFRVADLS